MEKFTPLGNDLDIIIANFDDSPDKTERQRSIWYKSSRSKAITHTMLGRDHVKALRLLEEDGFDGEPVGRKKASSARRFWDYNDGHVFPTMQELIRFGVFMHLDLYRILFLVLKGEWEYFFCRQFMGWRANRGTSLLDLLINAKPEEISEAKNRFNPDAGIIFEILEGLGRFASRQGYSAEGFNALVQEMVLSNLYRVDIRSTTLATFVERKNDEQRLFREGSPAQQEAFLSAKLTWLQLTEELNDLLLHIENRRLNNQRILQKWLMVFGEEEIRLRKQVLRVRIMEMKIAIKEKNPELSMQGLSRAVRAEEEKNREEIRDMELNTFLTSHREKRGALDHETLSADEMAEYLEECKKTLRKIYRLIHPDQLRNHPNFNLLNNKQKQELEAILLQTLDIKLEELGYTAGNPQSEIRSLENLRNVLKRVEKILDFAGIDTAVNMIPQGETIGEQLAWLQEENIRLERELNWVKAEFLMVSEYREIRQKAEILASPDRYDRIRKDLDDKCEKYRHVTGILDQELADLFSEEVVQVTEK